MKTACIVIALAALGLACDIRCQWSGFKSKYGKSYTVSEDAARFVVFQQSVERIQRLNSMGHAKFAINRFSDLTLDEFSALHAGVVGPVPQAGNLSESARLRRANIPDTYFAPSVTPVRSQGQCGSCWSFASMGVLEATYLRTTQQTQQFSTQQLVDCARTDSNGQGAGCQGGNFQMAFDYLTQHRAMLESAYPYTEQNGNCQEANNGVAKVVSYNTVGWDDESQIMSAVMTYGPIGVTLSGAQMSEYSSGVLSTSDGTCQSKVDHAVVLVGWTTVDGIPAWIIKNSWGNWWGVQPTGWAGTGDASTSKGFMYIKRGPEGCGITQFPATYLQQIDSSSSGSGSARPASCVPADASTACPQGSQCGTANDGCGGVVSCGYCYYGYECQYNQCVAPQWYRRVPSA
eukprot:m51a1_g13711 hypothetical protein (403) ;mRNA; r:88908-90430